jgi:hypothetical protein
MRFSNAIVISLALAACRSEPRPAPNSLADELVEMARADQDLRKEVIARSAPRDTKDLERLDAMNTDRLKAIVASIGWPGISVVGERAADAAWLLLQHSPDPAFQERGLELMQRALERGDARGEQVALLTDRVRVHRGERQIYGTQFELVDGRLQALPIEARAELDQRRAKVGLAPIAQYARELGELYHLEVVPPR